MNEYLQITIGEPWGKEPIAPQLIAEIERKGKLFQAFDSLERRERRRKKPNNIIFQRKYERVVKGLFYVGKKKGNGIHLIDERKAGFGVLLVTPEISELLLLGDALEGVFGFRNDFWRVQFVLGIASPLESVK